MSNAAQSQQWPGHNLGEELESQVGDLPVPTDKWQNQAAECARHALQTADSFVREKPWHVIGSLALISLGLGFFLGRSR